MASCTEDALKRIFEHFPNWITKWEIDGVSTGSEDTYMHSDWGVTQLNSIFPLKGKTVLELGSLEAAHTKMLHDFGAGQITSIEGKLENFLKCCVIKNVFDLKNAKFHLGDLRHANLGELGSFDVCLCSGILYHLPEPQYLIDRISRVAPRLLINTQFAKDEHPTFGDKRVVLRGKQYKGKLQDEVNVSLPATGMQQYSLYLFKDDLIQLLHDVGYDEVRVLRDWSLENPSPERQSVTIFAEKDCA